MFRFNMSPVSRRASAPFGPMPVNQPGPGMPMQMAAPALPPQVQPQKAEPSVFTGINGLLDMDESKGMADRLKGMFGPSPEEMQANEFMGLMGGMGPGQQQANEFMGLGGGAMGIAPGEWDWMKGLGGGGFNLGGLFNW